LADPELEQTWERVNMKEASLVVACLVQVLILALIGMQRQVTVRHEV